LIFEIERKEMGRGRHGEEGRKRRRRKGNMKLYQLQRIAESLYSMHIRRIVTLSSQMRN